MASTTTPLSTIDHSEFSTISIAYSDIVVCNILSRLDGLSLTSLSCTSSYFNTLSSEGVLWRQICTSLWPSLSHPRVQELVSSFPNGHRRLFSDSFPLLTPYDLPRNRICPTPPSDLLSAVDIWYENKLIFSRVIETETKSRQFLHFPFRIDLLNPKEVLLTTCVKTGQRDDDTWISLRELEENLTLSWIIFNPKTKRSANFSSTRPVTYERHWIPGEYDLEYATVLGCERVGYVECKIVVTCGGLEHGELHVRDACMRIQNIDGKYVNGENSLMCLMNGIEYGKRKSSSCEKEGKKMHEEYLTRKKLRWEKRVLKDRAFGFACGVGVVHGVVLLFYLIAKFKIFK